MSKVDQKGVFLERLFGAVVSIVTTMVTYQNVCAREDDRVQTLIGTQRGSTKKRRKRHSPRAEVEKDASIKSFVAIVCQHLFEGCNGCT